MEIQEYTYQQPVCVFLVHHLRKWNLPESFLLTYAYCIRDKLLVELKQYKNPIVVPKSPDRAFLQRFYFDWNNILKSTKEAQ